MAKIRVNHFGSKTIDTNATVNWEMLLTEVFIAFLLGVFAYMGYKAKILLLFVPCAIISLVIILSLFYPVLLRVKERMTVGKNQDQNEAKK